MSGNGTRREKCGILLSNGVVCIDARASLASHWFWRRIMEVFLDTADLTAIEELSTILPLAGITTNPSIVAAGRLPLKEILPKIRTIIGPSAALFALVLSRETSGMIDEAN